MEPVQFLSISMKIIVQNARHKNMRNRRDIRILLIL